MVGLLLALAVHRGVFKERLLGAMVSGRRPEYTGEDIQRRPLLEGELMVLAAGAVWAMLTYLPWPPVPGAYFARKLSWQPLQAPPRFQGPHKGCLIAAIGHGAEGRRGVQEVADARRRRPDRSRFQPWHGPLRCKISREDMLGDRSQGRNALGMEGESSDGALHL